MRTLALARSGQRRSASPTKRSRSTRRSPTAWGWARSAANWKTSPSSYLEPEAYAEISEQIESRRLTNDELSGGDPRRSSKPKLAARGRSRASGGPGQARLLRLSEARRQKITLDQVYDLLAVRIVTDSVKNCYARTGRDSQRMAARSRDASRISSRFPGRTSTSRCTPRSSGPGAAFEVQIRTEEMHRIAEEGIAAHWKYKEGRRGAVPDEQQIAWLRQLVEWQKEMRDPGRVHVHPQGGSVPGGGLHVHPARQGDRAAAGASPIDFAYAIHSDVGHTCVGRQGERAHRSAALPVEEWRRGRDPHQAGPAARARTGCRSSRPPGRATRSSTSSMPTERAKAIEIGQKYLEQEARRPRRCTQPDQPAELESVASEYGCAKLEDLHAGTRLRQVTRRARFFTSSHPIQRHRPEPRRALPPGLPLPAPPNQAGIRAISSSR